MTNELKITVPEGMEIDTKNSTFECIKFKPIDIRFKSWEEYIQKNSKDKDFVEEVGSCLGELKPNSLFYLKVKAFLKLKLLRDTWVTKKDCKQIKEYSYYVPHYTGARWISANSNLRGVDHDALSFPTSEMCKEFIDCFKDIFNQTL